MDRETDETNYMRGKWLCSQCGRLNSIHDDDACPRCIDTTVDEDGEPLTASEHTTGKRGDG